MKQHNDIVLRAAPGGSGGGGGGGGMIHRHFVTCVCVCENDKYSGAALCSSSL